MGPLDSRIYHPINAAVQLSGNQTVRDVLTGDQQAELVKCTPKPLGLTTHVAVLYNHRSLEEELQRLEETLNGRIDDQQKAHNTEIDGLNGAKKTLNERIDELNGANKTLNRRIDKLEGQVKHITKENNYIWEEVMNDGLAMSGLPV